MRTSDLQATVGQCYRLLKDTPGKDKDQRGVVAAHGTLVEVLSVQQDKQRQENYLTVQVLKRSGCLDGDGIICTNVRPADLGWEPGVLVWSDEDSRQAVLQGWDIVGCGGNDPGQRWQLQRVDQDRRFRSDSEAQCFVWANAQKRDPLALKALQFLYARCAGEYRYIQREYLQRQASPSAEPARAAVKRIEPLRSRPALPTEVKRIGPR